MSRQGTMAQPHGGLGDHGHYLRALLDVSLGYFHDDKPEKICKQCKLELEMRLSENC